MDVKISEGTIILIRALLVLKEDAEHTNSGTEDDIEYIIKDRLMDEVSDYVAKTASDMV